MNKLLVETTPNQLSDSVFPGYSVKKIDVKKGIVTLISDIDISDPASELQYLKSAGMIIYDPFNKSKKEEVNILDKVFAPTEQKVSYLSVFMKTFEFVLKGDTQEIVKYRTEGKLIITTEKTSLKGYKVFGKGKMVSEKDLDVIKETTRLSKILDRDFEVEVVKKDRFFD